MTVYDKKAKEPCVYIVAGARTPFLKARGKPGAFSAADLGVRAAQAVIEKLPFAPIDEVIVGCVSPSEQEANIARIIALRAGCKEAVPAWTVQRNCASGLQAIACALQSIRQGESDLVLAGGTEAMSRTPLLLNAKMVDWLSCLRLARGWQKCKAALQFRLNFLAPVVALKEALTDPVVNLSMGQTAQELAYRFGITRQQMDSFALQSHQRAQKAQKEEFEEIVPLYSKAGVLYDQDDGIRAQASLAALSKLRAVFEKKGDITAGNSSQITDGAAFVALASEAAVERYQLPVLAKVVDVTWAALDPKVMGLGPLYAMAPLLRRHALSLADIAHIEINEAFSAQVLACVKAANDLDFCQRIGQNPVLGEIAPERLNPQGGAIALGHPVGASGARLVLHCAHQIKQHRFQYALASLCVGGGQGGAILLARQ